jgi:organic radical activating enzyme
LPDRLRASILLHLGVSKGRDVAQRIQDLWTAAQLMSLSGGNPIIILMRLLAVLMERREGEDSIFILASETQVSLPPGPFCPTEYQRELSLAGEICSALDSEPKARKDSIQYDLALSDLHVRRSTYDSALQLARRAAQQAAADPPLHYEGQRAQDRIRNIEALQTALAGPRYHVCGSCDTC